MSILKQEESPTIGKYLGHFHRLGTSFLSRAYKDYNIGAGQYQFLISLYMEDGVSHDVLTEKMIVDKATTTRAVMKLEQEGYVTRVLNEDDKRKYHIFLTDKAKDKKEEILAIARTWDAEISKCLTEEELKYLDRILYKMAYEYSKISQKIEE